MRRVRSPSQPRCSCGQDVPGFVDAAVGGGHPHRVVARQARHPGGVEQEPAGEHRLGEATEHPPVQAGPDAQAVAQEQSGGVLDGGPGGGQRSGVDDRTGHGGAPVVDVAAGSPPSTGVPPRPPPRPSPQQYQRHRPWPSGRYREVLTDLATPMWRVRAAAPAPVGAPERVEHRTTFPFAFPGSPGGRKPTDHARSLTRGTWWPTRLRRGPRCLVEPSEVVTPGWR